MKSRQALLMTALLGIALLGGALALSGFFDPRPDPTLEEKLSQASSDQIEPMIANETERLNVTALGLLVSRGNGIQKAYHFGRSQDGAIMQAASLSKAVAAAVILIVADSRGVGIDDDVAQQISTLDLATLEGGDRPITLRQLLSHTTGASQSGFPGYPRGAPLPSTAEVIASPPRFFEFPLSFDGEPGEFRYSGGGYTIAQLWTEDVTGKGFADIAYEVLLAPLGMGNSTFAQPIEDTTGSLPAIVGADAGFDFTQALFTSLDNSWHDYPEQAAAGLWTTPADYTRFVAALLSASSGGVNAIPPTVAKAMLTPQVDTGWEAETGSLHYGLGVMLELDDEGEVRHVSHTGANAGYRAHFMAQLAKGEASETIIVSMANTGSAAALNKAIVYGLIER